MVSLQDCPDARRCDRYAHSCEFSLDPAVAPGRVLPCQPEDEGDGARRHRRPSRTPVWIGPAPGDQVAVPTEQRGRAHEEPLEMPAGEQLCQSGEQRPAGRLERRPVDLAPEDRHLVTEHDDFDRQVRVRPTGEPDQLKDATQNARYRNERAIR